MNQRMQVLGPTLRLTMLFIVLLVTNFPVLAQSPSGPAPTVQQYFTVSPIPFTQAGEVHANAAQAQNACTAAVPEASAPEIVELARALNYDPDLIYQYVHDNIEFSPLWGSLKGPVGTLLDGRGDSFDQASLMVALLYQAHLMNSSVSIATFEYGMLSLNNSQLQGWLGTDSNPYSIAGVLSQGGIPNAIDSNGNGPVGHVWVKVAINNTPYIFDPAFKAHTWTSGVIGNLASIIGYSQTAFTSDANATVTPTSIQIQNSNRLQLRQDLAGYAAALGNYIRARPSVGMTDIIGGGVIIRAPFSNGQSLRQSSNPLQNGAPTEWSTVPDGFHGKISITLPGACVQTFNSDDIYGRRLSIFFDDAYVPTLTLDGHPMVSGTAQTPTSSGPVSVPVTFGITTASLTTQTHTQQIVANKSKGGGGYIVMNGWDQVGRGMIEKHRILLNQAAASGGAASPEAVLGEGLAIQGYTWLAEVAAQQQLSDQLLGTKTDYIYGVGIVGEAIGTGTASPYVDLPLNFINTPTRINGGRTQTANSTAAFLDNAGTSSSFESASLEQTQARVIGFTAASTVKLLDIGLQNGDTVYDINSANWGSIEPLLAPNYTPSDLSAIDCYVNGQYLPPATSCNGLTGGYRVIAPLHGKVQVGTWTGVGYKALLVNSEGNHYGELISGALSGGFGGTNDPPDTAVSNFQSSMPSSTDSPTGLDLLSSPGLKLSGNGVGIILDPVDHQKGSYQYKHEDLTVGAKAFPYGLNFERAYDSGAQGTGGPLGSGWTHNYAITASADSDGFAGLGQASPLSAVSSIVALYVSADLVSGQPLTGSANLENFVLETVVNKWFTDQLTGNVVNVRTGWSTEQFTKLPDGSYAPPLGSSTILDVSGGGYRYRTKTGVTMNFDPATGQISSWTNAAGATVTFAYTNGTLSTITSSTGRQLTLGYNGGLISSVGDGTRTVSYGYANGQLTSFTDALSQQTTFAYDTSGLQDTAGHLTQVFYPSHPGNAFVTNYYDSLGRVMQQKDAIGNATQMHFAGSRTEIADPLGNRHVWYNDARGNVLTDIQDYGPSPHLNVTTQTVYDAQSNVLTVVAPEGNSVGYQYDSYFNPSMITELPKPGSSLAPIVRQFTYTAPVTGLPNYEEVHTSIDPNTYPTTFTYNSNGTLWKIDQPAVSKPGMVGTLVPEQLFTYTGIGLPQTLQDAEGRITRYDYDPSYGDEVNQTTVDYGNLNLITQYGYDSYGDVNSATDANGHITTSQFDALRRLKEVDGAVDGVITKYAYYPDGQIDTVNRQVDTSKTEQTQYTYTLSDKLYTVTDPLDSTTTTTYDNNDRVQTVTTQVSATQNRQRTYSYDALSRAYQVNDTTTTTPGTLLETHTYTLNGLSASFTDANNQSTTHSYDGFDRLDHTTYPDLGTEHFQYDPNGNATKKTTRSNKTILYTYDVLNRIHNKTPQDEAAGPVTYGYDLSGRLLQSSDVSSVLPYTVGYDTAGRANSYTDQQGRNTQVQYDGVGNRVRLQWPANTNGNSAYFVTYRHDEMNRLTEIDENGLATSPLVKYDWDNLSRQRLIAFGDGTTDAYDSYDAGDNLQALTQTYKGGSGVTFSYTWWMNHQRNTTGVSNGAFQYSPSVGTANYDPVDPNNGYTTSSGTTFTYDGNRNLTFDGISALTFDVENRLIQARNQTWGTSQYLYDPMGQRKQKISGGLITQFVLAGGEEIADFVGTGIGTASSLTVRGAGDLSVAAITPSTTSHAEIVVYYHHDIAGSTVAATQPGTSGYAEAYTYDEFGVAGAGNTLPYRYAGYRYDKETGLYYVRARYYSPALGRFIQTDPSGLAGGANLYAYAVNDPVNMADRSGLSPDELGSSHDFSTLMTGGPSQLIVDYSQTKQQGGFTYYFYQVADGNGTPLSCTGCRAQEHFDNLIVDGDPFKINLTTSGDDFLPLEKGYIVDELGFGPIFKQGDNLIVHVTQTFTVQYMGANYNLPTQLLHTDVVDDGKGYDFVDPRKP